MSKNRGLVKNIKKDKINCRRRLRNYKMRFRNLNSIRNSWKKLWRRRINLMGIRKSSKI